MKETADGTLILDADDCRAVAGVSDWLTELLGYFPANARFTDHEMLRLIDSARHWYHQYGPLKPPPEPVGNDPIGMLEGIRDLFPLSAKIGAQIPRTSMPTDFRAMVDGLLEQPPRIAWDGAPLHGALLVEVGLRAARELRRVRRRLRRKVSTR